MVPPMGNVVPPSHAVGVEPGVEVEAEGLQKAPSPSPMVGNGDCKTLWVGDIQPHWDEGFVEQLFAHTGETVEVKLIRDKHTGYPAGYGFVEFESRAVAEKVLDTCNGTPIPGTPFRFRLNWGAGGKRVETPPEYSVFVGDLAPEVTDQVLQQLFATHFPSTLGAKVVMDPMSGMSKGFGFVRFGKEEDRDKALSTMTGKVCGSRPIRVAPATARKPASGTAGAAGGADGEDPTNTTVFVGGIDATITEEILRESFAPFGEIVYVKIPPGRGCGFVQYVQRSSAETAISKMQGEDVKGCKVRLSWGRTSPAKARDPVAGSYPVPYVAGPTFVSPYHMGQPPRGAHRMEMGPSPGPEGRAVWQYHYQQGPYAQPGYAAPPYQYQSPYTHMSYGYPGGPSYPPGSYAYSPPMDMAPLHPGGMGERSLSASSLNSYPPAYYDRNTPDMGPRHVAGGGHKPGASVGGNSVSKLTARMDRLDISAEGPAYGPKPAGGGGGRGRPHMRGGYRGSGGYPPQGYQPSYDHQAGHSAGYQR